MQLMKPINTVFNMLHSFGFLNLLTDDLLKNVNQEVVSLAENFREQAAALVELLDISIPMVAKLKVCLNHLKHMLLILAEFFAFLVSLLWNCSLGVTGILKTSS
jgi:hypothetical protein